MADAILHADAGILRGAQSDDCGLDLRKAYEAYHPQLPEFMAAAIKVYAEKELP